MLAGGIYTERSALSWCHLSRPGSIDNNPPSLALADHLFRRRLAAQECTLGIYRHQPIPGLLVRIDQATYGADSCIADKNIELTEVVCSSRYHPDHVFLLCNVHLHRDGPATAGFDLIRDRLHARGIANADTYPGPLLRQQQNDRAADPSTSTGDSSGLTSNFLVFGHDPPTARNSTRSNAAFDPRTASGRFSLFLYELQDESVRILQEHNVHRTVVPILA